MTRKENKKVMYLGPTIRGVVKNGAVFEGGIPKNFEKIAGKKPIIQNLIVPLENIVDVSKNIRVEGTAEAIAFDKIAEISEAEVKEFTEGE
jgi:hypothetical protein